MLLGHHEYPDTYQHLLSHPVWDEIFTWLKTMPADLPIGEHEIRGRDLYVNHMDTATADRSHTKYEAHRQYLDMHYCVSGGELIDWAPVPTLQPTTEYDAAKDFTLFAPPNTATTLRLTPHAFAVFFPNEAHMTKISDGSSDSVHKLVFKIKLHLLH